MVITRIQDIDKKRCYIWIDEEIAFVLYKGDLHHYGIEEGPVTEELVFRLKEEVLNPRAFKRAMFLLEKKDYTIAQMRDKLKSGYYPVDIVERVLEQLLSLHYLNDERYALQYITCSSHKKTRRAIEMKLREKGIAPDIIDKAFERYIAREGTPDELNLAKQLLKKRHYLECEKDRKEIEKHLNYLIRKGFSYDVAKRAMQELREEGDLLDITL